MSWKVIDRKSVSSDEMGPGLSAAAKDKIRGFFPRYPNKRAVTLPALHIAQDEIGYVSLQAMRDIAALLEIPPAAVMDVVTFYTHFWTHPKGRKVIVACRSISCELMGAREVLEKIKQTLGIEEHESTPDGRYALMTEECLAACEHAPCMLINERMHKCVRVDQVEKILADPNNDKLPFPRSPLFDAPAKGSSA